MSYSDGKKEANRVWQIVFGFIAFGIAVAVYWSGVLDKAKPAPAPIHKAVVPAPAPSPSASATPDKKGVNAKAEKGGKAAKDKK